MDRTLFIHNGQPIISKTAANQGRMIVIADKKFYFRRRGKLYVAPDGRTGDRLKVMVRTWLERLKEVNAI